MNRILWLAMVFAVACATNRPPAGPTVPGPASISVQHYDIEIPVGYEMQDVSPPMMDFDVYQVWRRGQDQILCVLYFGNHPKCPKLSWSQEPTDAKGEDRTTTSFERPDAIEGRIQFSGLTYQRSSGTPFTIIHYLCDKLDERALKDMRAMIASIKVARAHMD